MKRTYGKTFSNYVNNFTKYNIPSRYLKYYIKLFQ